MSLLRRAKMKLKLRLSKPPLDDVTALPDILLVSLWLVAQKGLFGFIRGLFCFSFYAPMHRQQAKTKNDDITM